VEGRQNVPDTKASTLTLPAEPASAAVAREFVRDTLRGSNQASLEDAALLCVSELVANAAQHTPSTYCVIRVTAAPGDILIEVTDEGIDLPSLGSLQPLPGRDHGRGLHIIEALSQEWGVRRDPDDGKSVWVRISGTSAGPPPNRAG
jgi:serine/threonine-protein kinase RsbW